MKKVKINKELVLEYLKDNDWTQVELAERLGITPHGLQYRWRNGWPIDAAYLLASLFRVKVKELVKR